jgi:hypothetical protein
MRNKPKPIALRKPTEWDWPECYETVGLSWAKDALDWAHASTLARYLRETPAADIDDLVLGRIRKMLDPAGGSPLRPERWRLEFRWLGRGRPTARRPSWPISANDLADLLDPKGSRSWQLVFKRLSAGNPGHWDQYQRRRALATDIKFTRLHEKPSWAVEHRIENGVPKKRRVSRATAYRALKALRPSQEKPE